MNAEQSTLALGRVIERQRVDIERRWLERLEREIARAPEVALTHLRDGLPAYLEALAQLLLSNRTARQLSDGSGAEAAWADIAREHGITRVRIGFDITQLIHEFVVLRQVIRDVAEEHGVGDACAEAVLYDLLDAGIRVAVKSYVEARDYDARRRQAEHVGFLAHELRNPLSTAALAVSHLRRQATPGQGRLLDVLERNLRRLGELIDGVLLTQRLEAGKVTCRPSELALGGVMDAALEGARTMASEKGLAFRASYDPEVRVRVDPDLTRAAVQNVADNAARYTDTGAVEISVDDREDHVVIHVRDTCHGISPEELRTIFEPFERGSTPKPGTGLGLAIARRAVEAQGGAIGAESPGPSGCHFWIRLPK
ncbi:MAG: sensor histidine kinase [Labilithrix sp.]|nr:sensor histidine kinase [Labilithrix sp.]MCW5831456.1 sensor histidine kinase [Labilithrix sp.]